MMLSTTARRFSSSISSNAVVLVDAVRTPFLRGNTDFAFLAPHLAVAQCYDKVVERTAIDPKEIEFAYGGCISENSRATNVGRQAVVASSSLPKSIPGATINTACLAGFSATIAAIDALQVGRINTAIVGAVDFASAAPVRLLPPMESLVRGVYMNMKKSFDEKGKLSILNCMKPNSFNVEDPFHFMREASTTYMPGYHTEMANKKWNIPREEQDHLAVESHKNAAKAQQEGKFDDHVMVTKVIIT